MPPVNPGKQCRAQMARKMRKVLTLLASGAMLQTSVKSVSTVGDTSQIRSVHLLDEGPLKRSRSGGGCV
jgi:hypothetical protein